LYRCVRRIVWDRNRPENTMRAIRCRCHHPRYPPRPGRPLRDCWAASEALHVMLIGSAGAARVGKTPGRPVGTSVTQLWTEPRRVCAPSAHRRRGTGRDRRKRVPPAQWGHGPWQARDAGARAAPPTFAAAWHVKCTAAVPTDHCQLALIWPTMSSRREPSIDVGIDCGHPSDHCCLDQFRPAHHQLSRKSTLAVAH